MISLTLPLPPSLNQAYRNVAGVGRVKSQIAKKWDKAASDTLRITPGWSRMRVTGRCGVTYQFYFKDARRCDIANREKLLSDFLVKVGILEDDSLIDRMLLVRAGVDAENPRAEITLEEI